MKILLECLVSNLSDEGIRYTTNFIEISDITVDPDLEVQELIREKYQIDPKFVLIHSTSWRFDDGKIILTYLVYSEAIVFGNEIKVLPFSEVTTDFETFGVAEKRAGLSMDRIVSHAYRHLAFLIEKAYQRKYKAYVSSCAAKIIMGMFPTLAGEMGGD